MKTAGTLPLRAALADLALSPEGESLYVLDLSEGKVYRIRPDTLQIAAQADVIENAVAMSLTPDGKTIYVGGRDPDPRKPEGSIQAVSTATMKMTSTFPVPFAIRRLAAANNGTIAATGFGKGGGLAIIQAGSRSLVATVDRIYAEGSLRKNSKGQHDVYDSPYHGDYPLGGEFEISPDGRFLIGCSGSVLRLGRTKESDLRFAAAVSPAVSIAFSRGTNAFVLSTVEGFLKWYEIPSLELKKSVKVGLLCTRLALDFSRGRLYAVTSPLPAIASPYYDPTKVGAGNVISFSLASEK